MINIFQKYIENRNIYKLIAKVNNIGLKKHLKAYPIMINRKAIDKVQIYETIEATATRKTSHNNHNH